MSPDKASHIALRSWSTGDLSLLHKLLGDPDMMTYLGGPETPDQIEARHHRYCALPSTGKGEMFVILAGDRAAGSIGYWERAEGDALVWETGWSVLPGFQGQGVATQATLLLIERLRRLNRHRYLHAYPSVDNIASNAICKKAAFTLIEQQKFEYPPGHWITCNNWRFDLQSVD